MLDLLRRMMKDGTVFNLLRTDVSEWNSLAVRYETPHVDRLWRQVDDVRLNLHRIYPCDKPLYHPHPWPSAVLIINGSYEMGVGDENGVVATTVLTKGSMYEMVDPRGWHYVKPLRTVSHSIMLTGKPWDTGSMTHPGKGVKHKALDPVLAEDIQDFFVTMYPVLRD